MVFYELSEKSLERRDTLALLSYLFFFIGLLVLVYFANQIGIGIVIEEDGGAQTLVDVIRDRELSKPYGRLFYNLGEPLILGHSLSSFEEEYLYVWRPWRDISAPKKGWLSMENRYYRIDVNLDRSYYLLYDKTLKRDVLVFNEDVLDQISILTGSDIGFSDHGGFKPDFFATTALSDVDGIERFGLRWEDGQRGFLLMGFEGWDVRPNDSIRGYDVEAEVLIGLFADKPYFIDATEVNNLQALNLVEKNPIKDPDEIVRSWVLDGEYDSAVIKGGDIDHLNGGLWEPWYVVSEIRGHGRKPWHFGSAQFSKLFPMHRLIGKRSGGAVIFSLPDGVFRFNDSLGAYGDQVVGEFLLVVDMPERAFSFSSEPVNEYDFFYDIESFDPEFIGSMHHICDKYDLVCPDQPLDWHNWSTKRFAYVVTLMNDWYDSDLNQPYPKAWNTADLGLRDLSMYEDVILREMEATTPLLGLS